MNETVSSNAQDTEFDKLLAQSFSNSKLKENTIITGEIVEISDEFVLVDVGAKTDGKISIREFGFKEDRDSLKPGDKIEVMLESLEDHNGNTRLSRSKAIGKALWSQIKKKFENGELIEGSIVGKCKGGLVVEAGLQCFLPGSQVSTRVERNIDHLLNVPQSFAILKIDERRNNIVVSRRAVLEENSKSEREKEFSTYKVGQIVTGKVKAITDYGCFVSLDSMDSLLHSSDIGWKRISHPSEVLKIDQVLTLMISKLDNVKKRVSVSLKAMQPNPWEEAKGKININDKVDCTVTNVTDYGVFAELNDFALEGLIFKDELSFSSKINSRPAANFARSQSIEASVLDIDWTERKLSLSIKSLLPNPYLDFNKENPVNTISEVEIVQIKDHSMICSFIGKEENLEIEGILNTRELSYENDPKDDIKNYKVGDRISAKIISNDEKISLSVRALEQNPFEVEELKNKKKGSAVTCVVLESGDFGLKVRIGKNGPTSIIKKSEIALKKSESRPERFAKNDRVDAAIQSLNTDANKISLSIKALEAQTQEEAMKLYGKAGSDSGASLGDILSSALGRKKKETDEQGK